MKRTFALNGKLCTLLVMLLAAIEGKTQDPQFSQYYANPIYTNPAFAGGSNVARGVLNYRSQWAGIPGGFRTFSASYDEHFDQLNGGIGAIVTTDEAGTGVLRTTSANLMYSYQIIVSKKITIRAGVQAGFFQKTVDFSKFNFRDQIVAQRGFIRETGEQAINDQVLKPNFAAGFVIYSPRFYAGFASHNLTEPNQTFYPNEPPDYNKVPRRYTAHGGLVIPVVQSRDPKKSSYVYPTILAMQQGAFNQLNLGIYYQKGLWVLGSYLRANTANPDAFIFLFGIKTQKVRIGLSYDRTVSENQGGAQQSFEVSLSFELRKRTPRKTIRNIRCPEF